MNRKSIYYLLGGLVLFAALIGLAIWVQSAYLLYAASAVPMLLVPLLPDFRSSQWIKASAKDGSVQIFKLATVPDAPANHLILQMQPGTINWKRKTLYINMHNAPTVAKQFFSPDAASVPVLSFDLITNKRKPDIVGIRLDHVAERTSSFSFTTDEITRFVIKLDDLNSVTALQHLPTSHGKQMQA